ncbi:MAG: hypothetical protein AAF943_02040 [Pseudomonadota bacterium]
MNAPATLKAADAKLRAAGYVPLPNRRDPVVRAYLVDDGRPAVGISPKGCLVRAKARTGQAQKFDSFVKETFSDARALPLASLGRSIEKAWQVQTPIAGVVATERKVDVNVHLFTAVYTYEGSRR